MDRQSWAGNGIRHFDLSPRVLQKMGGGDDFKADLKKAVGEGFQGNPFIMSAPEVRATYYDPDFSTVAVIGEQKVTSLLAAYEDLKFSPDRGFFRGDVQEEMFENWTEVAKVYHLETEEFVYDVTEYTPPAGSKQQFMLDMRPNGAGRPRYTFAAGHLTSAREPHRMFRPLIHAMYPTAQHKNLIRTLMASGAMMTGRPMLQEVKVGTAADESLSFLTEGSSQHRRTITIDLGDGKLPQPRPGYEWRPLAIPVAEHVALEYQQLLLEEQMFGYPAALRPDAPLQATSGYDRARIMEAATDVLGPPLNHRASAWHEGFWIMFEQLKWLGLPITFVERGFAQKDMKRREWVVKPDYFEDIDIVVSFESVPATVKEAMKEGMRQDVREGYTARSTYMGSIHDDPVAERERVAMDQVGLAAEQLAAQDAIEMMRSLRGDEAVALAAEFGIPLPNPSADGRPGGVKPEEPIPGGGSPIREVPQPQPAGSADPGLGTESIGEAGTI